MRMRSFGSGMRSGARAEEGGGGRGVTVMFSMGD